MSKTFVQAGYETDELGVITPLCVQYGVKRYYVDSVLDTRQAHSAAGGNGLRFTVRIGNRITYVFLDDHDRWFVELRKVQTSETYIPYSF